MSKSKTIKHNNILDYAELKKKDIKKYEFICRGCTIGYREDKWNGFLSSNSPGDEDNTYLTLEEEPNNKYDPNAIMVVMRGEFYGTCGYVGREFTSKVKEILDCCNCYRLDMVDISECGNKTVRLCMSYDDYDELLRRVADARGKNE